MPCEFNIEYVDSATVTWAVSGNTVTATAVGGAGGAVSSFSLTNNPDGSTTIIHDPGDGTGPTTAVIPAPQPDPCPFTATNGQTAHQSGAFYDACDVLDLGGAADPEALFPTAGFPEWWRQPFVNGVTGSEAWVVQADTLGVLQWHQIA